LINSETCGGNGSTLAGLSVHELHKRAFPARDLPMMNETLLTFKFLGVTIAAATILRSREGADARIGSSPGAVSKQYRCVAWMDGSFPPDTVIITGTPAPPRLRTLTAARSRMRTN